jgi:hypothetical protein
MIIRARGAIYHIFSCVEIFLGKPVEAGELALVIRIIVFKRKPRLSRFWLVLWSSNIKF